MCIRDRGRGKTAWVLENPEATSLFTPYLEGLTAPEAVSYTHLDVYKRQLLIRLGGITVAKSVTNKVNRTELDSKEFFAAIAQIEEEKGIKKGYMMEKITQALISAYRRDHEGVGDNLTVEANEETGAVSYTHLITADYHGRLLCQ